MDTNYTILSKNDASVLEEAVVRYGRIVTFSQLNDLLKDKYASIQVVKNRISFLLKSGWLISV